MKIDQSKLCLRTVTSNIQGRQFIWEIISFCGVYKDMGGDDVHKALGRREVGLHILGLIADLDDEIIFNMMREAKERELNKEIEIEYSNNKRNSGNEYDPRTSEYDPVRDLIGESYEYFDSDGDFGELPTHSSGGVIF